MAIVTGSTVIENAMPMPVAVQLDNLQHRLARYRTSTAMFRSMVSNGILSESDYKKSCDILANKYGLSLCSIFR